MSSGTFNYTRTVCSGEKGIHSPHPQKHFKADLLYYLWLWAYNFFPMIDCEMKWIPLWFQSKIYLQICLVHPQKVNGFAFSHSHVWYHRLYVSFLFFPETHEQIDTCILKITLWESRCAFPSPRSCSGSRPTGNATDDFQMAEEALDGGCHCVGACARGRERCYSNQETLWLNGSTDEHPLMQGYGSSTSQGAASMLARHPLSNLESASMISKPWQGSRGGRDHC